MVSHLTQADLAKRWRMGQRTLESWRVDGIGPCYLKIGNRILYRLQDIEAFEESRLFQQVGHPPVGQKKNNARLVDDK